MFSRANSTSGRGTWRDLNSQLRYWNCYVPSGKKDRTIITALQLYMRGLAMSICLSVRPSVKRVHCDKTKAPSEKSSILTNRKSTMSFLMSLR